MSKKPRFNRYRPRQMRKREEEKEVLRILNSNEPLPEGYTMEDAINIAATALAKDAAIELMYWVKKYQYMELPIILRLYHSFNMLLKVECGNGRHYSSLVCPSHSILFKNYKTVFTEKFISVISTIFAIQHEEIVADGNEFVQWEAFTFSN